MFSNFLEIKLDPPGMPFLTKATMSGLPSSSIGLKNSRDFGIETGNPSIFKYQITIMT